MSALVDVVRANFWTRHMSDEEWHEYMVREYNDLADRWEETAALLADAMAWIDESMHQAGDDLETGHALLARFAVLERRAANPAGGAT